jgi:hypothetical protein
MATSKSKTFKQLACKICGEIVPKVDINADKVTCSLCVQKSLRGIINTCDDHQDSGPKEKQD